MQLLLSGDACLSSAVPLPQSLFPQPKLPLLQAIKDAEADERIADQLAALQLTLSKLAEQEESGSQSEDGAEGGSRKKSSTDGQVCCVLLHEPETTHPQACDSHLCHPSFPQFFTTCRRDRTWCLSVTLYINSWSSSIMLQSFLHKQVAVSMSCLRICSSMGWISASQEAVAFFFAYSCPFTA